jgi:hypothetical protein
MTIEEQIRAAVAAVDIRSRVRFRWLGALSAGPSAPASSLSEGGAIRFLVASLARRLYLDFFVSGGVRPATEESAERADTAFRAALREANTGKGPWGSGWQVLGVDGAWVIVTKDGLTLRVPAGSCRPNDRLTPGTAVEVRFPKDLPHQWPGYYLAMGDRSPTAGVPTLRLYWHVSPPGVVSLVRSLTSRLNGAGVAFKLKVLDRPSGYERCDPAVLYIPADSTVAAARQPIRDSLHDVGDELRAGVPAMTKRLRPGLAAAHDPGDGSSFGLHRCGLLAEGIVRAHEQRARTIEERMVVTARVFRDAGLDLSRPYLGANSRR